MTVELSTPPSRLSSASPGDGDGTDGLTSLPGLAFRFLLPILGSAMGGGLFYFQPSTMQECHGFPGGLARWLNKYASCPP